MSAATSKRFYTVRQIARATGLDKATIRRQARRENWPMQPRGNRFEYAVPGHLVSALKAAAPARSILDRAETIRALDRAAAVNGFVREMRRDPKCGIETALARTVSNFRHLKDFSVRVLRHWTQAVERGGLGALHEHKLGRVGRRATALHKILK
jgi:hypothetical protein